MTWVSHHHFAEHLRGVHCDEAEQLRAELVRELSRGHVLYGMDLRVAARALPQDEVIAETADGVVAPVHMTRSGRPESPPWPTTEIVQSADHLQECLNSATPDQHRSAACLWQSLRLRALPCRTTYALRMGSVPPPQLLAAWVRAIGVLAGPAELQEAWLDSLGPVASWNVSELGLEFDDGYLLMPQWIDAGWVPSDSTAAVEALNTMLESMSGQGNGALDSGCIA